MSLSSPNEAFLPPIPTGENEPVFSAPWEARAFAIVNQLAQSQACSWNEWTEQFAKEIAAAESMLNNTNSYYECWVQACEKLLITKGILDMHSIDQRIEEIQNS